MTDTLNELLARLRHEQDLDLAAVGADGLLVGADCADGLDAEGICLAAGDAFLLKTALGAGGGRGRPRLLTVEFEQGTIDCTLEHGAELTLLTRQGANLGRLRIAARHFQAQYRAALVPA